MPRSPRTHPRPHLPTELQSTPARMGPPKTDNLSTKAPIWMKPRPTKPPKEKQKSSRLGEKLKYLAPIFESQPNELQWTMMNDNVKCMLNLCEKVHRKTESLSRSENEHYYDEHDLNSEGKPKRNSFVRSSCRLKSPLFHVTT